MKHGFVFLSCLFFVMSPHVIGQNKVLLDFAARYSTQHDGVVYNISGAIGSYELDIDSVQNSESEPIYCVSLIKKDIVLQLDAKAEPFVRYYISFMPDESQAAFIQLVQLFTERDREMIPKRKEIAKLLEQVDLAPFDLAFSMHQKLQYKEEVQHDMELIGNVVTCASITEYNAKGSLYDVKFHFQKSMMPNYGSLNLQINDIKVNVKSYLNEAIKSDKHSKWMSDIKISAYKNHTKLSLSGNTKAILKSLYSAFIDRVCGEDSNRTKDGILRSIQGEFYHHFK